MLYLYFGFLILQSFLTGTTETEAASVRVHVSRPVIESCEVTNREIIVNWVKMSDVDGFIVYRDTTRVAIVQDPDAVSYTDAISCANGERHIYRVAAYKMVNGKAYSSPRSSIKPVYFLRYTWFTAAARKGGNTSVTWVRNPWCSGYQLQYSTSEDFSSRTNVNLNGATTVTWNTDALPAATSYYIRVRAYKRSTYGNSYSPWSSPVKIVAYNTDWTYAKNAAICSDSAVIYYPDPYLNPNLRKNKTVCINAGHGTRGGSNYKTLCHPDGSAKVTSGTTATGATQAVAVSEGTVMRNGTPEAAVTLSLALVVRQKLLAAGYNVLMIREDADIQLDNVARTVMANNNADCHIALHYDSTTNDKGAFFLSVPNILSYRNMYPVSALWQSHHALGGSIIGGLRGAGVKIFSSGNMDMDLTQTSYSTIPSIDLEVGDVGSDFSDASLQKLANGITAGLNSYF